MTCILFISFILLNCFYGGGENFREKWKEATRMLRIHKGRNEVKKVENHC